MSRYVTSGGHSHSCGIRTHVLIDLFDTAQAIGVYAFHVFVCLFFKIIKFLDNFWLNLGFLGKSCCSEKIVTDFLSNVHFHQLGSQSSNHGRQVLPDLLQGP